MESEGTNESKESSITTRILSSPQNGFGGSRDKNIFEIVTISEVKAKKGAFDTCAKKLIIASISMFWFIACTAYSTIAPFFPGEAAKKGVDTVTVGLIFTVFPLTIILLSPIVGIVIPIIGLKLALFIGLTLEGGSQIIFGFLAMMPDRTTFIVYAFIIRITGGSGAALTSIASITLLTQTCQDELAFALGIMETFGGFGFIAGPPLGGLLYAVGGFKLPFIVVGLLALTSIIPLGFILPSAAAAEKTKSKGIKPLVQALTTPAIFMIAITNFFGGITFSFLGPTLENHLEKPFHLSSTQVGLMFLISAFSYAFFAPISGIFSNKFDKRAIIVIGAFISGFGYIILGPAPFLPSQVFPSALWLNGVSLGLIGLGNAGWFIPTLPDMNESSKRCGLEEGIETQSALSSIYSSTFYMGSVLGPIIGGILTQHLKFPWSSTIFGFMCIALAITIALFTACERRSARFTLSRSLKESSKECLI